MMGEARRTGVQGEGCWHLKDHSACKPTDRPPGSVTWDEHQKAWEGYAKRQGRQQSAERMAQRGGFGYLELTEHLGHEPRTWKPKEAE